MTNAPPFPSLLLHFQIFVGLSKGDTCRKGKAQKPYSWMVKLQREVRPGGTAMYNSNPPPYLPQKTLPHSPRPRPYLVGPDTLHPREPPHASPHFHVLVRGVHLPQALANVGHHPPQHLPAHDHSWPPHAEVLAWFQCQLPHLLCGAEAGLPQEQGLAAVQAPEEVLQFVPFDVNVVVSPHKPFVFVQVVVMHVFEHHEGFLLGWVGVIYAWKRHDGDGDRGVRTFAGEEFDLARNGFGPRSRLKKTRRNN